MNISIDQWRVSIGLFHGITAKVNNRKFYFWSSKIFVKYLTSLFKVTQAIFSLYVYLFKDIIKNSHITLIIMTLLFLAFDIEQNPGPSQTLADLSILHLNIRSIRNKTDLIKDNFLAFNILCFSESHLDMQISNDQLFLSDIFDQP